MGFYFGSPFPRSPPLFLLCNFPKLQVDCRNENDRFLKSYLCKNSSFSSPASFVFIDRSFKVYLHLFLILLLLNSGDSNHLLLSSMFSSFHLSCTHSLFLHNFWVTLSHFCTNKFLLIFCFQVLRVEIEISKTFQCMHISLFLKFHPNCNLLSNHGSLATTP